jgi:glycosyltransferase involved in cell wall biosynthesis
MLKPELKRIAIIAHEASATGAPILLLKLIRLLTSEYNTTCEIILLRGGVLENEFSKLGNVIVVKTADYSTSKGLRKLQLLIKSRIRLFAALLKLRTCEFIFNNSIINGWAISVLKYSGKPIVTYVHELHSVVEIYSFRKNVLPVLKISKIFFYPCLRMKDFLIELGVAEEDLFRLNYFFDAAEFKPMTKSRNHENSLQVCGVGVASYRKGTDLFLSVAAEVVQKKSNIFFTWIGGFSDNSSENSYRSMVDLSSGRPSVYFTGVISPDVVKNIYSKYDVLFLTSREDPYPLVVLEAAANKIPSIIFKDTGGISDFVNEETGFILDINDRSSVVNLISSLTPELLREKGIAANSLFLKKHCNKGLIIQQFCEGLKKIL